MRATRYLIVGGGLAADAACTGIREVDPGGRITVVSDEAHPPYARPPLSKALWTGKEESTIWRATEQHGAELQLGRRVAALDLDARRATDDRGETYSYERLLLATGGRPRQLPFGGDEVIYYRTLDDYRRLRALASANARFVVIGGGFIGSEIAAALETNGHPVTMVFPEPGIGARVLPAELSAFVTDYYRAHDVEVLTGASVTAIERAAGKVRVETGDGRVLESDAVVAGLGIAPRTELAEAAGLVVSDGIVVATAAASTVATTSSPPATSPDSPPLRSEGRCESSTRTTRRPTGGSWARTWPGRTRRTTICRSSTPTSSTSATRRSESSTADCAPSPTGPTSATPAPSTTSTTTAHRGACCCGTSSDRSTQRAT